MKYAIHEIEPGEYICKCKVKDRVDEWSSASLEGAIESMKKHARVLNHVDIEAKDIFFQSYSFPSDNSCGPCESEP